MAVFLNWPESLNLKMTEIASRRNFKDGEYLNMTKVRHFMERGGRVVR
jgi:hypothetical protein